MIRSSLLLALCVLASCYASDPIYSTQPIETRTRYSSGPIQTRKNPWLPTEQRRNYRIHDGLEARKYHIHIDDVVEGRKFGHKPGDIILYADLEGRRYSAAPIQTRKLYSIGPIQTRTRYSTGPIETRKRYSTGPIQTRRRYSTGPIQTRKNPWLPTEQRRNYRIYDGLEARKADDIVLDDAESRKVSFTGPLNDLDARGRRFDGGILEARKPGDIVPDDAADEKIRFIGRGKQGDSVIDLDDAEARKKIIWNPEVVEERITRHRDDGPEFRRNIVTIHPLRRSFLAPVEARKQTIWFPKDSKQAEARKKIIWNPEAVSLEVEERSVRDEPNPEARSKVVTIHRPLAGGMINLAPVEARKQTIWFPEDSKNVESRKKIIWNPEARSLEVEERITRHRDEGLEHRKMGTSDGHFYGPAIRKSVKPGFYGPQSLAVEERRKPRFDEPYPPESRKSVKPSFYGPDLRKKR